MEILLGTMCHNKETNNDDNNDKYTSCYDDDNNDVCRSSYIVEFDI